MKTSQVDIPAFSDQGFGPLEVELKTCHVSQNEPEIDRGSSNLEDAFIVSNERLVRLVRRGAIAPEGVDDFFQYRCLLSLCLALEELAVSRDLPDSIFIVNRR